MTPTLDDHETRIVYLEARLTIDDPLDVQLPGTTFKLKKPKMLEDSYLPVLHCNKIGAYAPPPPRLYQIRRGGHAPILLLQRRVLALQTSRLQHKTHEEHLNCQYPVSLVSRRSKTSSMFVSPIGTSQTRCFWHCRLRILPPEAGTSPQNELEFHDLYRYCMIKQNGIEKMCLFLNKFGHLKVQVNHHCSATLYTTDWEPGGRLIM